MTAFLFFLALWGFTSPSSWAEGDGLLPTQAEFVEIHRGLPQFRTVDLDLPAILKLTERYLADPKRKAGLASDDLKRIEGNLQGIKQSLDTRKRLSQCSKGPFLKLFDDVAFLSDPVGCSRSGKTLAEVAKAPLGFIPVLEAASSEETPVSAMTRQVEGFRRALLQKLKAKSRLDEWFLKNLLVEYHGKEPEPCPAKSSDSLEREELEKLCSSLPGKTLKRTRKERLDGLESIAPDASKRFPSEFQIEAEYYRLRLDQINAGIEALNHRLIQAELPSIAERVEHNGIQNVRIKPEIVQRFNELRARTAPDLMPWGVGVTDKALEFNQGVRPTSTRIQRGPSGEIKTLVQQIPYLRYPSDPQMEKYVEAGLDLVRERRQDLLAREKLRHPLPFVAADDAAELTMLYPATAVEVLRENPALIPGACMPLKRMEQWSESHDFWDKAFGGLGTASLGVGAAATVFPPLGWVGLGMGVASLAHDGERLYQNHRSYREWQRARVMGMDDSDLIFAALIATGEQRRDSAMSVLFDTLGMSRRFGNLVSTVQTLSGYLPARKDAERMAPESCQQSEMPSAGRAICKAGLFASSPGKIRFPEDGPLEFDGRNYWLALAKGQALNSQDGGNSAFRDPSLVIRERYRDQVSQDPAHKATSF